MDNEKLLKLLNLTSSKNDGEALSAIRRSNEFIKQNYVSWEEIVLSYNINNYKLEEKDLEKFVIINMNLKKERIYSEELKERIQGYKNFIKFMFLIIIIMLVGFIIK